MGSVQLKKLRKKYNDLEVVHGIDLEIQPGEFIVLVGPSGCGKSTTLRMIAGLEEITDGEILIDGNVVNDVAPKDRNISMVFQNYALYPHMSVKDNMSFALKLRNESRDKIDQAVNEAANILGLTEYLERRPNELSGGQRQRVAMGRAIVRNPKVFLFDEPLSNLDAKLRTQMRAEIKRLHYRMKTTIVYVTHDQVEAMTLADRIVIMNGGNIEQVGTPEEIYSNPKNTFVANFIGSPPMNLVSSEKYFPHLPEKFAGKVIGVRPEHLTLNNGGDQLPLKGPVEFIETLGAETLIHLKYDDQSLTAKIPSMDIQQKITLGEELQLYVSPDKVFSFDPQTQARC
jgi:multiple sugar transport system ATP-binding protein